MQRLTCGRHVARWMPRRCWAVGLGVVTVVLASGCATPPDAPSVDTPAGAATQPAQSPAERIVEKLKKPVTLDFTDSALADVVDFLRDFTGENVVLDRLALEEQGITPDTPITLKLAGVSLKTALSLILEQIKLAWIIRDEVLFITTEEQAVARPAGAIGPEAVAVDVRKRREIEAKLRQPVTFDFTESALSDVVAFLRDFSGVNVVLDQPALEEEGISGDTTINLKLTHVTLSSALNLLFDQLALTWLIRDEVLFVTTRERARALRAAATQPAVRR